SAGYGVLLVLLIGCGLLTLRAPAPDAAPLAAAPAADRQGATSNLWRQRLWWLVLAVVPSSLLVGVTTHIATDVASAPFLWAPPLMLYIGSFIVVFAKRPPISLPAAMAVLPVCIGLALFTLSKVSGVPTLLSFVVHLMALFFAAVACHGLLAS